jgi:hypothetical protein
MTKANTCLNGEIKKIQEIPKLIVCLKGIRQIGKTGTLIELIRILFPRSMNTAIWHPPVPAGLPNLANLIDPITVEMTVNSQTTGNDVHVGIYTRGDIGQELRNNLSILANNNCSIIFCSCRTGGDPYAAVQEIARNFNYALITTAPYTMEIPPVTPFIEPLLNNMKAGHLEAFI